MSEAKKLTDLQLQYVAVMRDRDALRAQVATLRAALKRYGQHEAYCAFDPPLGVFDLCTCGLTAALTERTT